MPRMHAGLLPPPVAQRGNPVSFLRFGVPLLGGHLGRPPPLMVRARARPSSQTWGAFCLRPARCTPSGSQRPAWLISGILGHFRRRRRLCLAGLSERVGVRSMVSLDTSSYGSLLPLLSPPLFSTPPSSSSLQSSTAGASTSSPLDFLARSLYPSAADGMARTSSQAP